MKIKQSATAFLLSLNMADAGYKIRNKEGVYFVTFAVVETLQTAGD